MSKWITNLTDVSGNGLTGKLVELVTKGGSYPTNIVASTTGSPIAITDAGNGVYYTADGALDAADYDIYVGGVKESDESPFFHAELSDVLLGSDVIDDLVSVNTDKPLSANQGKNINDKTIGNTRSGTVLSGSNKVLDVAAIINTLLSTVTDKPLSAAQGKVLKDVQDSLASKTPGTGLETEGTNKLAIRYLATDFYIDENDYFGILMDFANQQILLNGKTLTQNLERLQKKILDIQSLATADGGNRIIYSDNGSATASYSGSDWMIYTLQKKITLMKLTGDDQFILNLSGKGSASGVGWDIKLEIKDISGSSQITQEISNDDSSYTQRQIEISLAGLTDGELYEIEISLKPTTGGVANAKDMFAYISYS